MEPMRLKALMFKDNNFEKGYGWGIFVYRGKEMIGILRDTDSFHGHKTRAKAREFIKGVTLSEEWIRARFEPA